MGFNFEKLDVYRKSVDYARMVYDITKKFPESERYGLTSQLRRAVVSISANIAEGSGRYHNKDFMQFLRIARGSVYECIPLLEISSQEKYIQEGIFRKLVESGNELAKMLNGLIGSLDKK